MRVLFVDDNRLMLRIMEVSLKDYFEIDVCTNHRQAFTLLHNHTYDVIFLDYEMPEMNGEELLKKIREMEGMEDTPIVFVTGTSNKSSVLHLLSLKPAGYLVKPVNVDQLLDTVAKVTRLGDSGDATTVEPVETIEEVVEQMTDDVLSVYMHSNYRMQEFNQKIADLCYADVSNVSALKYMDQLLWLKKSTVKDVEKMMDDNQDIAYELAKEDYDGIDIEIDIISSNTALKYLCRAELVLGNYNEDKIKDFFRLSECDENRITRQTDRILEYKHKIEMY